MTIKDVTVEGKAPKGEPYNIVETNQEATLSTSYPNYETDYNNTNDADIPILSATLVEGNTASSPLNSSIIDAHVEPVTGRETTPTTNYPAVETTTLGGGTPLPTGARWITIKHAGGVTWTLCTLVSILTCCIVLCPCGLWAFACPCDEIRAYEVNGQVYDENGRPLGHISKFRTL